MAERKAWTEAEKLHVLFQLIAKAGPIQLNEIDLPEGRTKKAVQVMLDKEKQKIKKAQQAMGKAVNGDAGDADADGETKAPKRKRKAAGEAEGGRKPKAARKKKGKAGVATEEENEEDVKSEAEEEE